MDTSPNPESLCIEHEKQRAITEGVRAFGEQLTGVARRAFFERLLNENRLNQAKFAKLLGIGRRELEDTELQIKRDMREALSHLREEVTP